MKWFRRKELLQVWEDEPSMMLQYRRIWDSSPVLRRFYRDLWGMAMTEVRDRPVVEIGGGAGLIREYYPEVITSDYHFTPWTNLVCDASRLPFSPESVGSYVAVAFFHHCVNPRRLFEEILRTLVPGGRCVIVDPYFGTIAPLIYRYGTDETFDLTEPPFETEARVSARPLLEANVARATVVFERHRSLFEQTFPSLRIASIEHVNLFRHIAAGSFVQKSPFPDWFYSLTRLLDTALIPVSRYTGICMKVVLEKASCDAGR